MALVEIGPGRYISNKGIMSIKQGFGSEITIRYISGECETIENLSMGELLAKLNRLPREMRKGDADSP